MKGRILSNIKGVYEIYTPLKNYYASSRGIIRNRKEKIEVGDYVQFDENKGVIFSIEERKNQLIRPSIANIDLLIIISSIKEPDFSYSLILKYLTYANKNNVPAFLFISKVDNKKDYLQFLKIKEVFEQININIYPISKFNPEFINNAKQIIQDKTICLLGQSGVGKSSLLNLINSNFNREIGEYSKALGRGKHQTKEVRLLPYLNGFIADTPGFSSLELNCFKEDLAMYFPGFKDYNKCFYPSCLHISETKCYIKKLLMEGKIPEIIYFNYLKLSEEAIFKKERFSKR